jgi:hypothetical protein
MDLLSDIGHVESRFNPFGDSVCVSARQVRSLRQTSLRNCFGRTRWYSLVTRLKCMLVLVCLEIVLTLTQDRCIVCTERTVGSEIVLDAPGGSPR